MDGSYRLVITVSLGAFRTAMILAVEGETTESTSGLFMPRRMPLLVRHWQELLSKDLGFIVPTSHALIAQLWSFKPGLQKSFTEKLWADPSARLSTYFQDQE